MVGWIGHWNGPIVLSLALASGLAFFDLGRRAHDETTPGTVIEDLYGPAMQLAFLAVLCAGAWDNRLPATAWRPPGFPGVLGLTLLLLGAALRRSAARALGRHFTVALSVLADHELIATGPYRWVRHPNYAGLLLIAIGTATMVRSPHALGLSLVVWLPLVLLRIHQEEAVLHERLGAAYEHYARERWCLIPGVY